MEDNNEVFEVEVDNWTNKPVTNVLENGRYTAEAILLEPHNSAVNECIHGVFLVEGIKIDKYFIMKSIETQKRHSMAFQYSQFLYAIGFRNKETNFKVKLSDCLHKPCKVDVKKEKEGTTNAITFFSPIEAETAPIKGVEPEEETKNEPEKKETEIADDDL